VNGSDATGTRARWNFAGKVVVVTGAAQGIGARIAGAFESAGARVTRLDRQAPEPENAVNVTDHDAIERAFLRIVSEQGPIDVLVNNAGIAVRGPALTVPIEAFRDVLDVNLTGTFICARLAARSMQGRGGSIVNVASVMGLSGGLFPNAAYQASKGGVVNLTRALALEWASDGIRVNAVAPNYVDTQLTEPIFSDPQRLRTVMAHAPLGRLPTPDDVAEAVLYLASDSAASVTGHVLAVDSGYLAR